MPGRGFGMCRVHFMDKESIDAGLGLGFRRGCKGNLAVDTKTSVSLKDVLKRQKQLLENRLDVINRQLEDL